MHSPEDASTALDTRVWVSEEDSGLRRYICSHRFIEGCFQPLAQRIVTERQREEELQGHTVWPGQRERRRVEKAARELEGN